jgi:chemotaxis protein methyltransferase CheR
MGTQSALEGPLPAATLMLAAGDPLADIDDDGRVLAKAIVDAIRDPLLVLDTTMHVVTANRAFYRTFKMRPQNVRGCPLFELGDGQWNIPELRGVLENMAPRRAAIETYEAVSDFAGIGRRTLRFYARTLLCEDSLHAKILLAIEDVTERRARECKLEDLLKGKDVLLQEMRHRIANNLQINASILHIKTRAVCSKEARQHLQDVHRRIMAVAAAQRQLVNSDVDATVELAPYLARLCATLAASMIDDHRPVSLKVHAGGGTVSSGQAVSIGLIVTELVINALKYAFPHNRRDGTITVDYDLDDPNWKLMVSDNGIGRPADQLEDSKSGLGTTIVEALAKRLDAGVDIEMNAHGTKVSITHAPLASRISAVA